MNQPTSSNVNFGYVQSKNKNNTSPPKPTLNLVDNIVRFGFKNNNEQKETKKINEDANIEPGEIKENIIKEKKEIIKDNIVKEEKEEIEDKKKEKNEEKKDKPKVKKETIFVKSLFDNNIIDTNNNNSIFTQKLFQNNNKNSGTSSSSFGLFSNKNNNMFNSFFDNKKTEELFFKNNGIENSSKSFVSNSNNKNFSLFGNEPNVSGMFNTNTNTNNKKETDIKQTLNNKINDGNILNADPQKKEDNTKTLFQFSSIVTTNPFTNTNTNTDV